VRFDISPCTTMFSLHWYRSFDWDVLDRHLLSGGALRNQRHVLTMLPSDLHRYLLVSKLAGVFSTIVCIWVSLDLASLWESSEWRCCSTENASQ
jgi:hypothetical protein